MCDEDTVQDNARALGPRAVGAAGISRRQFTTSTAAAAAMFALLPRTAHAANVIGHELNITTPDGVADCYFAHPAGSKSPGVIVWPDIRGLRPAFAAMGKRLAESGYAVLVVNPFYRAAKAPILGPGASFEDPATRATLMGYARALTPATVGTDTRAFVGFLDAHTAVDTTRRIGTTGYCMGGAMALRAAATLPERIGAGASFHGGGLVTDKADSPHLLVPHTKASFLFAIAANDDERQPEAKTALRQAYANAQRSAEIEVYAGALHGWCPPDSPVYNAEQAERAWARLLALFGRALA